MSQHSDPPGSGPPEPYQSPLSNSLNNNSFHNKRWYDAYENIRLLMEECEQLPYSTQCGLGQDLLQIVQGANLKSAASIDLRTLGPDGVMGMFKSQQKLRWYDQIPAFHKAMNMMRLLPDRIKVQVDGLCAKLLLMKATEQMGMAGGRTRMRQSMSQTISQVVAQQRTTDRAAHSQSRRYSARRSYGVKPKKQSPPSAGSSGAGPSS